jgi:hypothetical protein
MRLLTWWVLMGTACLGLLLAASSGDLVGYLVMSGAALVSACGFDRALHS